MLVRGESIEWTRLHGISLCEIVIVRSCMKSAESEKKMKSRYLVTGRFF